MQEKKKTTKKRKDEDQGDFSGHLLSASASIDGPIWRFELVNKKGEFRSYALESNDPVRVSTVTMLVTSAYLAGKKIHVRGVTNGSGDRIAQEVWVGAKERALTTPASKVEKRVPAEAQAPAAE